MNILDIAAAAAAFGTTEPYFANAVYAATTSGTVDIGDIATIASYFDEGLTAPFLGTVTGPHSSTPPAGLTQLNPNTDPANVAVSGGTLYVQGATLSGTTLTLHTDPCPSTNTCVYSVYTDTGTTAILGSTGSGYNDFGEAINSHTLICNHIAVASTCGIPASTDVDIVVYQGSTSNNIVYMSEFDTVAPFPNK